MEYHSVIKMNKTAICRDMNGPRVCPTEWSESEREKQTSYNIAYRGNLEKWYRWTYLKSRNSLRCKDKCMVTKLGWGLVEWIGRMGSTYIHYFV